MPTPPRMIYGKGFPFFLPTKTGPSRQLSEEMFLTFEKTIVNLASKLRILIKISQMRHSSVFLFSILLLFYILIPLF
ncbi:MAG: hypothetical protein ACK56F_02985, partial [bacterium]